MLAALVFAAAAGCQVRINEIMFDPLGEERSGEFVEIVNVGEAAVDLAGWCMGDADAIHQLRGRSGHVVLESGAYGVILSEAYFSDSRRYDALIPADALVMAAEGDYLGSRGLSNSRPEKVMLVDGGGTVRDSCRYSIGNDSGFSDERVDPRRDLWLDGCTLNGTPGFVNSVYSQASPRRIRLQAEPDCISRNMAGLASGTTIQYSLPMLRSYIIITIFTLQGRCIRSLTSGRMTGSSGSVQWNGLDDEGRYVRSGIYLIHVEGLESRSGKRAGAVCPVTVFTP